MYGQTTYRGEFLTRLMADEVDSMRKGEGGGNFHNDQITTQPGAFAPYIPKTFSHELVVNRTRFARPQYGGFAPIPPKRLRRKTRCLRLRRSRSWKEAVARAYGARSNFQNSTGENINRNNLGGCSNYEVWAPLSP